MNRKVSILNNLMIFALLLPFSGYTITKEERKKEIQSQLKQLDEEANHLVKLLENNLFFAAFCPRYFTDRAKDIDSRGAALETELELIEKELKKEKRQYPLLLNHK